MSVDLVHGQLPSQAIRPERRREECAGISALLRDRNLWILSAIYLCDHIANGGYVVWLPGITNAITKQEIDVVGLLTVAPFVLTLIGLYVFGTLSDRSQNRWLGFAGCFPAAAQRPPPHPSGFLARDRLE
jgi:MFS family permease